jgi:small subunit ribosomal protein S5
MGKKINRGVEDFDHEAIISAWVPRTRTGKMARSGEITSIDQISERNMPILEPQIVDFLLPDIKGEILNVQGVRRTTDSGRKRSFLVTSVVGNRNGYVGVGNGKSVNVKIAMENAHKRAKLNIMKIKRGCGSWECGCGTEHSVPFKVVGKSGSVRITLIPAPKGAGIVAGKEAKEVLDLAGIKDVWTSTFGDSRTTFNYALATLDALKNLHKLRMKGGAAQ